MISFNDWLYLGQTQFDPDDLNKREKELAELAWIAAQRDADKVDAQPKQDYCREKLKPGGCQVHNVHCGYPACNEPPDAIPSTTDGAPKVGELENQSAFEAWARRDMPRLSLRLVDRFTGYTSTETQVSYLAFCGAIAIALPDPAMAGDAVAALLVENANTVCRHQLTKMVNIDLPDGMYLLYPSKRVQPASGEDAKPDMFWNADDPEQCQDSIHNLLVEMQGNRFFYVGDIVEVQQAVKLPNIFVRLTSAEDDEGNGDMEYEVIDAAMQQESKNV